MPSQIIGRAPCPECGFASAHVKQSDKCLYRYCPECKSQTIAKTDQQQANMRRTMRPVDAATGSEAATTTATASATAPVALAPIPPATATPPVAKPAPAPRRGLFG